MSSPQALPPEARFSLLRAFSSNREKLEPLLTLEDVRAFLIDRINNLIKNNMGLLMSALYRIDVSEQAVNQIFATASPEQIASALADLIIERQIQKIRIRERYKVEPPDSTFGL